MTYSDRFTKQSSSYASFRPQYPDELFQFLYDQTKSYDLVWDCATGTGQAARTLAQKFKRVVATDVSASQISAATGSDNISFSVSAAESSPLSDSSADLITIAQAIHWFDFESFYKEVDRVLKPSGIISAWGYGFFKIDSKVDSILDPFSQELLGPYWTERNWLLVDGYKKLPFPFEVIQTPSLKLKVEWDLFQVVGYLRSWSAYQKYIDEKGIEPISLIENDLAKCWGDPKAKKSVVWDLHWLVGKKA